MFHSKTVISSAIEQALLKVVEQEAASRWPAARMRSTYFQNPPSCPRQDFLVNHALFAVDGNDEEIEASLPNWTTKFPTLNFAFIEVSCWGGRCKHRGFVCRSGEEIARIDFDENDKFHQLLEQVGICLTSRYFAPFMREYFRGEFTHPVFGELRRQFKDRWRTSVPFPPTDRTVDVIVTSDKDMDPSSFIEASARLYERVIADEPRIRQEAVDRTLRVLFDTMKRSDEVELTSEQLRDKLSLLLVEFSARDACVLTYDTPDLFDDRGVIVKLDEALGVKDVVLWS